VAAGSAAVTVCNPAPGGGVSNAKTFDIVNPGPIRVAFSPGTVTGGSAVASMPASVTVPAGSLSATFAVHTNPVGATTAVKIKALANGVSRTGKLTVNP